ncbi:focadhesin [Ischnura elegans]|uniref:focadhesin n=1 Tax=Ischnura elegans TaxID=197161 RepID=UPI001ED86D3B|nr:focadhesin [Ischnura elegans]
MEGSSSNNNNDPVLFTSTIAKLVDAILTQGKTDPSKVQQAEELKALKEKYLSGNPVWSLTASHGILSLIEGGMLGNAACTEFISMLPSLKNYGGALETLSGLLILDLRSQIASKSAYSCPFMLIAPQHPLISVLKLGRDSWLHVLNQMHYICYHPDDIVQKHSLEILRPVFLFILCSPKLYNYSKRQTWSLILNVCCERGWDKGLELLLLGVSWQQTENDTLALLEYSCMLCELVDVALISNQLPLAATVAPYLISVSQQLFERGMDPRMCISCVRKVLASTQDTCSQIAILVSEAIGKCPSLYLNDYILLCCDIVRTRACNLLSAKMILASLLQWLAFPNALTMAATVSAKDLVNTLRCADGSEWKCTHNAQSLALNPTALTLRAADSQKVDFAYILSEAGNAWKSQPAILKEWLQTVKSHAPSHILVRLHLAIAAVFLEGGFGCEDAEQASCELLLRLVEKNAEFGRSVLTLLLYKLAREKKPQSQLKLLHCMPAMAIQKENVPVVISTLESLKSKRNLRPLLLDLYVQLWKVESRCYPYLHKLMLDEPKDTDWEWELAKATVMKEVCLLRPHAQGKDLLPLLSQTLNRCAYSSGKGKSGIDEIAVNEMASAASALALAGATHLLKEKIIDACSVWSVLGPKLSRDRRTPVLQSLCRMFGVILSLRSPNVEYESLSTQLEGKLWSYIVLNNELSVKKAALEALARVNLSQRPLKNVPEVYRQNIKLPLEYAKTPVEAARRPEDVLPYTPGKCWIQLLQKIQPDATYAAGQLLVQLIKRELMSQRGAVRVPTNLGVGREPTSYSYLPDHSVLRAVADYLSGTSNDLPDGGDGSDDVLRVVQICLTVLGRSYPKQFPPLDWSFLDVYSQLGAKYSNASLCLAMRQACSSISARKFAEEKLSLLTPSSTPAEEILMLFEYLGDICKGIPPNSWRSLIEGCLLASLDKGKEKDSEEEPDVSLSKLLSFCKIALLREDIPDVNRSTLALIMESLLEKMEVEDPAFTAFVECVGELPTKYVERMSSPSVWWEVTSEKLRKGARIRCELASRNDADNPLFWLNEIIDAASALPGEYSFILKTITPTLLKCKEQTVNCQWTLQLMGQIMKMISDDDSKDENQAPAFLIDVWILCIVCMSFCSCLAPDMQKISNNQDQRMNLLPQALSSVLQLPEWQPVSPQVLEWLLHTSTSEHVPQYQRTVLNRGILSVHQNPHLLKKNAWMRFVGAKCKGK